MNLLCHTDVYRLRSQMPWLGCKASLITFMILVCLSNHHPLAILTVTQFHFTELY